MGGNARAIYMSHLSKEARVNSLTYLEMFGELNRMKIELKQLRPSYVNQFPPFIINS